MNGIRSLNNSLTDIDVQLPPKKYIKNVLEVTCDNLGYLFGTVIEIDENDEAHMLVSYNLPESYPEMVNKVKGAILSGPAGETFKTGKIVVLHDPYSDPRLKPWGDLRIITGIIEIMVWVPLFKNGKIFGICVLYSEKERDIAQNELSSLESIGVMISIAIASNKYLDKLTQKTKELQKTHDELEIKVEEQTAELQKYTKELQHSNELKNLFGDVLHHDLLNPAGIIKGYTEVLLNTEKDQKTIRSLKVIERNTEVIIKLVETVSHLAKLESVDDIEFQKIDLCDIIKDVMSDFESELDNEQITIEFTPKLDCFVNVNPLIKEVFINFLSNAIKYGMDKNRIIIDISNHNTDWIITVTDFGIGIPDEDKPHLFERFKRTDRRGIKGMGLGLAIVKRIIDLHGGRVGVENNPNGQGSVFWITLKKA